MCGIDGDGDDDDDDDDDVVPMPYITYMIAIEDI